MLLVIVSACALVVPLPYRNTKGGYIISLSRSPHYPGRGFWSFIIRGSEARLYYVTWGNSATQDSLGQPWSAWVDRQIPG